MVKVWDVPTSPPNTRLEQTGQKLLTASPPLAALEMNGLVWPLNRTAWLEKPIKGIKPEPEAFWHSVQ